MRTPGLLVLFAVSLPACGGGGGGTPNAPSSPPPPAGTPVTALVFYDENGNGVMEGNEVARVPEVEVVIGGRTARSERGTGSAAVQNVPDGTHAVTVRTESLPPFYQPGAPVTVTVPQAGAATVSVPLTLPIRGNRPNVYVAFGDSLTLGLGSPSASYPARLQAQLQQYFGAALVINRGDSGTNSFEGADRARRNIEGNSPAYAVILYGTNDWHDPVCQNAAPPCHTVDNLRRMVRAATVIGTIAVIATLPPVNPAVNPAERNQWIDGVNTALRAMAQQEGALVADVSGAFTRQGGDLSRFFADDVHPNDAGYDLIATAVFDAIRRR